MLIRNLALAGLVVLLPLSAALAASEERAGRYVMTETADGFLRLDTVSGDVSLCSDRAGVWACELLPDDRKIYEDEIASLAEENDVLREELGKEPQAAASGDEDRLPTDEELDQVFGTMEGITERFARLMKKFQKEVEELNQDEPGTDQGI